MTISFTNSVGYTRSFSTNEFTIVINNLNGIKKEEIKKTFENLDLIFLLNEYCNYIENEIH